MRTDPLLDKCFYIIGWILLAAGAGVGIARYCGALDFLEHLPPCIWHATTGVYCPGCGGTRALRAFLKGKILLSLYYHPFVVYCAAVGGWFMISQTIARLSRNRLAIGMHYRDIYLWLALLLVVLNCLIKNATLLFFEVDLLDVSHQLLH